MTTLDIPSDVLNTIEAQLPQIISIRHDLHLHPQLAMQETYASTRVIEALKQLKIPCQTGIANTGIVAWIIPEGMDQNALANAKGIGLRADMDALPIHENNPHLNYASQTPGCMHACGHDGHTATLIGIARVLMAHRDQLTRPVKLFFQPAEETASGAALMIEAGCLTAEIGGFAIEETYGLHGWPDLPLGVVGTRKEAYMSATDMIEITIHGQSGHAARPHCTVNPILAAAQIVTALNNIPAARTAPTDAVVVSTTMFHAGSAHNITPDSAKLTVNTRTPDNEVCEAVRQEVLSMSSNIATAFQCTTEFHYDHATPAVYNDPQATEKLIDTAEQLFGTARVHIFEKPHMVSEDFSYFGQHSKACFAYIGLNPHPDENYPALHTPEFNYNDDALPTAIALLSMIALQ